MSVLNPTGRTIVNNISLEVKAGEILAIAGVQGNGQSELVRAIMNLEENVTGSIQILGEELVGKSVHQTIHSGVAYIPESRELDGLVGTFSIAENLVLDTHGLAPFSKVGQLSANKISDHATKLKDEFDIRAQSIYDTANSLSGGNKQKLFWHENFHDR